MGRDLAEQTQLLDVQTGEVLPATPENAHRVLSVARDLKQRIGLVIADATAYLIEESRLQGTKTFQTDAGKIELSGGPTVDYDPEALAALLRDAGCPEDRIDAAVKAEVTYKVDRNVLKQLTGANENYAAAAERAKRPVEKSWRASAK